MQRDPPGWVRWVVIEEAARESVVDALMNTDKPKKLVLDDGSYFGLGCSTGLAGMAIVLFAMGLAMTQGGATLRDLALPMGALSAGLLFWFGINAIIGMGHRLGDRRGINRLFRGEIWQVWRFHSDEWQGIVETKFQRMRPEEGLSAYVGAVYSGIVGLVLAGILFVVGEFVVKIDVGFPIFTVVAGGLLVLMICVGLLQPVKQRWDAGKYRRRALRVPEPRVWFGPDGAYHETLGYTLLKRLANVTDRTRSRKRIKFVVVVTTVIGGGDSASESEDHVPVWFRVPSGYEKQAGELVRRYRQERLRN
jgi:hypothetical protein